jgi:hypothetical protein
MGCRAAVPRWAVTRTACNASHRWIGAGMPAAPNLYESPGRIAVPTFFRGGIAARAKGAGCTAARLIHMGVWRDPSQPGLKKRTRSATAFGHWNWKPAAQAAVDVVCSLDAGPLMGVLPGEHALDRAKALLEDHRVEVSLAASLGWFTATQVLWNIGCMFRLKIARRLARQS